MAVLTFALLAGCPTLTLDARNRPPKTPQDGLPGAAAALERGEYEAAERIARQTLEARDEAMSAGDPAAVSLSLLLAEAQVRERRFAEGEGTASRALALAVPVGPLSERTSQRSGHYRLARAYEEMGVDGEAERHYSLALELCEADATYREQGACATERKDLTRVLVARGRYREAEPLVLKNVATTQAATGAHDIRLAYALGEASVFYSRQGKHHLAVPLFIRGYRIWMNVHEDAYEKYKAAMQGGLANPFGEEFARPHPGHFPFSVPSGLDEQSTHLLKLNRADTAGRAAEREHKLWASGGGALDLAMKELARVLGDGRPPGPGGGSSELDKALAMQTVGHVHFKKGRYQRAEGYYREALERMLRVWPALDSRMRREHVHYYLDVFKTLGVITRSHGQPEQAIRLYEQALEVAKPQLDMKDARYLDLLMDITTAYRELGDFDQAAAAAEHYMEKTAEARGKMHPDYAWGLRNMAYVHYALGDLERSQEFEAEARAIWGDEAPLLPEF